MARHVDKVVVTNRAALTAKYGTAGYRRVAAAVKALQAADRARGLSSRVIYLDRPPTGVPRVADVADGPATVAAIDAVATSLTPLYTLLLGAPDVVAQPVLANPTPDDDHRVPSDLPYACAGPFTGNPSALVGPSRVVGRLPDALGATDPAALVALLGSAAGWRARPPSELLPVFGISAEVWKGSTRLSLQHLPGTGNALHLSPPEGPAWTAAAFGARLHFVNCHGADTDPHWYGQRGRSFPVAVDADRVAAAVSPGTVVAAECCYGAQHYNPDDAGGHPGVANAYLAGGAYGVFASSTLAYGPANTMGSADLLTRYFLASVLEGASLGRATLEARLRFVHEQGELDPIDLKTLAQFDLLGDPSIHPMALPAGRPQPKGAGRTGARTAAGPALGLSPGTPDTTRAASRRTALAALGAALEQTVVRTDPAPRRSADVSVDEATGAAGVASGRFGPVRTYVARSRTPVAPAVRFHVTAEPPDGRGRVVVVRDGGGRRTARVVFRR